jgi:hypothetical protein
MPTAECRTQNLLMNKSAPSYKQVLLSMLTTCLLVGVFWIFFDASKHNDLFMKANVFLEDPYDAVGSFGVQLAALGALLSFVRLLRPYPQGITCDALRRIIRGEAVALCAVSVTLSADGLAMLRYLHGWIGLSAGWLLVGSASALLAVTALAGRRLYQLGRTLKIYSSRSSWQRTLLVCLAGTLVLMFYPEGWRQSVPGGVFTALVGMAILFILTASIVKSAFPPCGEQSEDFLDDLYALYEWVKAHANSAGSIFRSGERVSLALAKIAWISGCINWLNLRKHAWNLVILVGLGMGLALFAAEAAAEGAPKASAILMVVSVYTGIETSGVLLGYALFKQYLWIIKAWPAPGGVNQIL